MGTTGQSITLANSIIGVGVLAMPFCFQQCGVLLATLILVFMGLVSRLCCYFLLKSALISRRRNFEFLAFHVFGPAGKLAVEVGIIGFLMGTCIAYFVVVGDLGPQIIAKMFNINQSDILRTSIMVIVSLVCVLPLGLLRNVDSLSNVSAATIGFYFCLVIKVIAEAASQLWAGDWHTRVEMWRPAGLLQCVPIFSMALFCQTQLFEIFESLPTLSLEKMNVVTKNAINICKGVYFTLGLFGYIAFSSQNISGNILMSLSPTMASDVIKMGFVMSLAFSFPLIIFPCRASLYSLLYKKVHSSHHDHIINHSIPEMTFRCITVAIIAITLFISLLIPNIELVLGLVGSTIGVLICVVFPAACFVNVTFKNTNERILAKGIVILGLVIMVLGTYANLQAAENQIDKYDDKLTQERIDKIVEDFFDKWDKSGSVNGGKNVKEIAPKLDNVLAIVEKDSVVQPPNPLPPESASKEKHDPIIKPVNPKVQENVIETNLQPIEPVADKSIEGHEKNLQPKLNEIKSNGDMIENKAEKPPKEDNAKIDTIQEKSQEKIDILKQEKLIETIKQHGEEQKELMKKQKEILDEIIKTKKELQQNKKDKPEVDSVEAKKLAVESIQKIANIAIQSLSGVTDKPADVQPGNKESEPLQKIANEAVQEIAKKAVESIVAINEIKEKQSVETRGNMAEQQNNIDQVPAPLINDQNIQIQQNKQYSGPNANIDSNIPIAQKLINSQPIAQIQNDIAKNINPGNQVNIQPDKEQQLKIVQDLQSANAANQGHAAKNLAEPPLNQINELPPVNVQAPNINQQPEKINPENAANSQPILEEQRIANGQPTNTIMKPSEQNVQPINGGNLQAINGGNLQAINGGNLQPINGGNLQPINGGNLQPIANAQPINVAQPPLNNQAANVGNQQADIPPVANAQVNTIQNGNIARNNVPNQGIPNNEFVQNQEIEKQQFHLHSPDEPQSYKVGEDSQLKSTMQKNIADNIPLPIAIKAQAQNAQIPNKPMREILEADNNVIENVDGAKIASEIGNTVPRQKREVVDCTEKLLLPPEDKEICENLITDHKIEKHSEGFLPSKVDLNDVLERKNLNFDAINHVRSLKSYDET